MFAGDSLLVVEFEARIDPGINARAVALADALRTATIPGVRDVVPTYHSVAVHFDPLRTDSDALVARLEHGASAPEPIAPSAPPLVRIPVCYGGEFGPDLTNVAAFAGLSEDEVVAAHTRVRYRVFMLGFLPGFAYLGAVDPRIAAPRHATPRPRVPAGSVGIAGRQTGVYPAESPGGWQLVGRTSFMPFDPERTEPFRLKAGDAVEFYAVDRGSFERPR